MGFNLLINKLALAICPALAWYLCATLKQGGRRGRPGQSSHGKSHIKILSYTHTTTSDSQGQKENGKEKRVKLRECWSFIILCDHPKCSGIIVFYLQFKRYHDYNYYTHGYP